MQVIASSLCHIQSQSLTGSLMRGTELHLLCYYHHLVAALWIACHNGTISEKQVMLLFSCQVVSNSLWPFGLQLARLPCPSPSPRLCSRSCALNRWCHPTISSSVVLFSTCLQSFTASRSFPMSQLFTSGGQGTGALVSAFALPKSIQDWFP